jgi:hypothetical protein
MAFFLHYAEAGLFVDVAGGIEFALRPQDHFLVSHLPREAHALTYQAGADT